MTTRKQPHVRDASKDSPTGDVPQIADPIAMLLGMLPDLLEKVAPFLEKAEKQKVEAALQHQAVHDRLNARHHASVRLSEAVRCRLATVDDPVLRDALAFFDMVYSQAPKS